mgnify:CR=1 FL=1
MTTQNLANIPNLTIQTADKGGAIVIMDSEHDQHTSSEHVNDLNVYVPVEQYPTTDVVSTLLTILNRAVDLGWISESTKRYLFNSNPHRPTIYLMPKIHKHPTRPPFRPIVVGYGSVHEKPGEYLDTFFSLWFSLVNLMYRTQLIF